MSYEYDDMEEMTQEEAEESAGMSGTDAKMTPEKLTIVFDTENFANGIVGAVVSEVKCKLYKEVIAKVREEILEEIKNIIRLNANEVVKEIITDYMQNEKIKIGGSSFWDDEPLQEFTMQEYAKKCIGDAIKNGKFHVFNGWEKDRYSSAKRMKPSETTIGFEEYIRSELALGNDMKKYMDEQIMEIRDSVNKGVKEMFDASMKQTLSESVLQVLMANETYQKIQSNIACIADKTTEVKE